MCLPNFDNRCVFTSVMVCSWVYLKLLYQIFKIIHSLATLVHIAINKICLEYGGGKASSKYLKCWIQKRYIIFYCPFQKSIFSIWQGTAVIFPSSAKLWNYLPAEWFPLLYDLNGFKIKLIQGPFFFGFFLISFPICLLPPFSSFIVTPCLVLVVQTCVAWSLIKIRRKQIAILHEEDNTSRWNRGETVNLLLLRLELIICQKLQEPRFWKEIDSLALLVVQEGLAASRTFL